MGQILHGTGKRCVKKAGITQLKDEFPKPWFVVAATPLRLPIHQPGGGKDIEGSFRPICQLAMRATGRNTGKVEGWPSFPWAASMFRYETDLQRHLG